MSKGIFENHFNMLLVGRAGTGKTKEINRLLFENLIAEKYDHIYIVTNTNEDYKHVSNYLKRSSGCRFYSSLTEVPYLYDFDIKKLVIFDRPLDRENQDLLAEMTAKSKYNHITCLITSQTYCTVSNHIKNNCAYQLIFNLSYEMDQNTVLKQQNQFTGKEGKAKFKKMLSSAAKFPNFMLVDNRTPVEILRLRKGWDHIWNDELEDWVPLQNTD